MFTSDINNFLKTSKKVFTFSFVENVYDYETERWDSISHLSLDLSTSHVYAAKDSFGNCSLYCDDSLLIKRLYHLCQLFNYDAGYNECGRYGTLMLVGCDGSCEVMGGISLFARVNGCKPDDMFKQ